MASFLNSKQAQAEEAQQAESEQQEYTNRLLRVIDAQQEQIKALDDTLSRAYLTIKSLEVAITIHRLRWEAMKEIADGREPADSG